ncbi:MAG: tRNA preQ1(34) S-adenosylmethionine ribosyltransferase-isomerase QueA [Rubrobacteraceae bacterium]
MLSSELDYELPENLIAQRPAEPRDSSRLMVVDVKSGDISHHVFRDLPGFLRPDDAVILNETKVLPARLMARKPSGGKVELLFLRDLGGPWEVLARPSKRLKPGLTLAAGDEKVRLTEDLGEGRWMVEGKDVRSTLERAGHLPLPPYIRSTPEAERSYQTVYARTPGSAAAPTAGFHFTDRLLDEVGETARIARVTLHVGTGTFTPLRTEKVQDHRMHAEHYVVPADAAHAVEAADRVVAVGTTVARTLETWAASGEREGESELFVYPGYRWRTVDTLLTNFHLPRSTLLAMIMSFAGVDLTKEAYRVAVEENYRFYSFGDAMLLVDGGRTPWARR